MKRIVKLVLVLTLALSMVACGKTEDEDVLKVGMEIGYPPFEYFDDDGSTPIGVDVELAYEIGERIGMEVELVDTAWDGIFAGIDKGDYDCVISAVTITSDRLLDFDFSTPYIQNYQCIVSLAGSDIQPASPEELDGLKIAYQEETTSDEFVTVFAEENGLDIEVFEYAKVMNCYDDLLNGRVDVIVCDSTVASSYVGEDSEFVQTWIQDSDAEEFGVCIKKGNTELLEKINAALDEMKND
jgi:polar amino acid transport system substrate-binding protein